MTRHYLVVFDDEDRFFIPMTWDADCKGSLRGIGTGESPVLFGSRSDARKAIRISTAFARLCKEQGTAANEDFLSAIKCVKVIGCVTALEAVK